MTWFQTFKTFQPFYSPSSSSPRRGGGKRWGLEPFDCAQDELRVAVERLERLELK
jgi:hypothetical protein